MFSPRNLYGIYPAQQRASNQQYWGDIVVQWQQQQQFNCDDDGVGVVGENGDCGPFDAFVSDSWTLTSDKIPGLIVHESYVENFEFSTPVSWWLVNEMRVLCIEMAWKFCSQDFVGREWVREGRGDGERESVT